MNSCPRHSWLLCHVLSVLTFSVSTGFLHTRFKTHDCHTLGCKSVAIVPILATEFLSQMLIAYHFSNSISHRPFLSFILLAPQRMHTPEYVYPVLQDIPPILKHTPYYETYPLSENISPIMRHTPITKHTPYYEIYSLLRNMPPITKHTPYYKTYPITYPLLRDIPLLRNIAPITRHTPHYERGIPLITKHTPYFETCETSI